MRTHYHSTKQFYDQFLTNVKKRLATIEVLLKEYQEKYNILLEEIAFVTPILSQYGYDPEYLLSKRGRINCYRVSIDNKDQENYVRVNLKAYHKFNTYLSRINREKTKLLQFGDIRLEEYIFLIERINDLVANAVIEGYRHDLGHGLGIFKGIANPPKGKTKKGKIRQMVDWQASNKRKAELIEQGVVLYNEQTAPNGVKWLVMRENKHSAMLSWIRVPSDDKAYIRLYSFKLEDHHSINSIKVKFYKYLNENPLAYLNYK